MSEKTIQDIIWTKDPKELETKALKYKEDKNLENTLSEMKNRLSSWKVSQEEINCANEFILKLQTLKEKHDLCITQASEITKVDHWNLKEEFDIYKSLKLDLLRLKSFYEIKTNWTDKQKKIIDKAKTLDDIKNPSDILFLKKEWVDLASLFLVNSKNPKDKVQKEFINEKDNNEFIVNFWENLGNVLNTSIWAGDILPATVKEIEINWTKWIRQNSPRPWYYTEPWNKYLPIFDWDKIKIKEKVDILDYDTKIASEKASKKSDEERFEKIRIQDTLNNKWLPLTDLDEDTDIVAKAKKVKDNELERINKFEKWFKIKWQIEGMDKITKKLWELSFEESKTLLIEIFWDWPWTRLLIELDWWQTKWTAIKRMIALWYHEWGLIFWRRNRDPKSWFNIWTFQIWWSWSTEASSLKKYNECLTKWKQMAIEKWINTDCIDIDLDNNNINAQKDLLTHLWYIQSQRKWEETFAQLRNPNLSDQKVIELMSKTIQWWVSAIWESVVAQLRDKNVEIS